MVLGIAQCPCVTLSSDAASRLSKPMCYIVLWHAAWAREVRVVGDDQLERGGISAMFECAAMRLCWMCEYVCVCVCVCTVPKPMECDHAPPPPPPIVPGEGCMYPSPHPICYTLAEHKPICGKPLFSPAISSGFFPPLRMLIAPYPLESALPRIEKAEG